MTSVILYRPVGSLSSQPIRGRVIKSKPISYTVGFVIADTLGRGGGKRESVITGTKEKKIIFKYMK